MKTTLLLIFTFALVLPANVDRQAGTPAATASPSVTTNLTVPIKSDLFNLQTNEPVRIDVEAELVSVVTFNDSGAASVELKCNARGNGTGLVTKDSYPFSITDDPSSNATGPYPSDLSITCKAHLLRPGAAMGSDGDLLANAKMKVTVNADATTTASLNGLEVAP